MDSSASVSVIIISRGRPVLLGHCLRGLAQLNHRNFEVIVVADAAGLAAVAGLTLGGPIKTIPCGHANISVARNLGLAVAAGEIVAFIDDDAVPEPTWLTYLAAPFSDSEVAAAGGFVRGRNGISLQWAASTVDATGQDQPLVVAADKVTVCKPTGRNAGQRAIKTQGTNCAFRRSVLLGLGGFDPAYSFYLDETDVNMRIARAGHATAIVPLAQVHHGFAASALRSRDRVPKDLSLFGASLRVFHDKFASEDQAAAGWKVFVAQQQKRLHAHMVTGALEPSQVTQLMRSLHRGYQQENVTDRPGRGDFSSAPPPFQRFLPKTVATTNHQFAGRIWNAAKLRAQARQAVEAGDVVSLYLFSPTALFHRVRFTADGYWEQRGGLFGRSERSQALVSFWSFDRRRHYEQNRVRAVRQVAGG